MNGKWAVFIAPEGMEPLGKAADGTLLAAGPEGVAPMTEIGASKPFDFTFTPDSPSDD